MSQVNLHDKRPLSPHITIYKPIPTMVMSIVHRITGVALTLGTMLFAWWLYAVSEGGNSYLLFASTASHPIGILVLVGYTWALVHHMLGGIRHFVWDFGHGFEKDTATKSAWAILIGSITITALIWIFAYVG